MGVYSRKGRGKTVNLLSNGTGGSNPPTPTIFERVDCMITKARYNKEHAFCPRCGCSNITIATSGHVVMLKPYTDHRKAICTQCGWVGIVDNLRKSSNPHDVWNFTLRVIVYTMLILLTGLLVVIWQRG